MSLHEKYIWASGYFDGEGCVIYDVKPHTGHLQTRLHIGSSNLEALELMQVLLGGSLIEVNDTYKVNLDIYQWYTTVDCAVAAAEKLILHSVVKRKELLLFLSAHKEAVTLKRRMPYEERVRELARRQYYHDELKKLRSYNKRNFGHTGIAYMKETQRLNELDDEQEEQDSTPVVLKPDPVTAPKLDPFRWVK